MYVRLCEIVCLRFGFVWKKFLIVCLLVRNGLLLLLMLDVIRLVVFVLVWVISMVGVFIMLVVRCVVDSFVMVLCVGMSILLFMWLYFFIDVSWFLK